LEKSVFVLLIGDANGEAVDLYQRLQERDAQDAGRAAGFKVDVAWATSFDQYGAVRKRLAVSPVDAVIAEPASVATASLILKHLQGRAGLVLLNVWDSVFEASLSSWGDRHPITTISQPQAQIGQIQGSQLSAALPQGTSVLVITGPARSSAARERLEGLRSTIRADITLHTTQAGQWTETDGILAFNSWYGVFRSRKEEIHAIAGQSDDLAVGACKGGSAVSSPEHAAMFRRARLFGVGAVPGYGKEMVDAGALAASVTVRPNAGLAIAMLKRFWADGRPLAARSSSEAAPYPAASVEKLAS
jgi:ABC-type sugar transport system substrate-binding protein